MADFPRPEPDPQLTGDHFVGKLSTKSCIYMDYGLETIKKAD